MSRRKPRPSPVSGRPSRHAGGGPKPAYAVDDPTLLYGRHAVQAALANPRRKVVAIRHTPQTADALAGILAGLPEGRRAELPAPQAMERADLDAGLPADTVHQGLVLKVEPLDDADLGDLIAGWQGRDDVLVVILDQVTDPHNVGAVLRSAAAFGASALIMQDRHGPPVTGTLAKTASGAVDAVPMARVVNLARAIRDLQEAGFWCTGLAEEGSTDLAEVDLRGRCGLVLGAEGTGLRRLTRETCDALARLPTCPPIGSLNVSAAAAVALYQARLVRAAPGDLHSLKS
ncbi:hypothetical protein GCM10017083_42170 [Thalassobaculum fulvum]|uniref:RNA 2-O ribose methyltransferase substrate binding domain-containing protein n=1 Tax=Thalassobaculum fulvum TaxID=1633335 RepID=A0A919CRD7_9PROT|nr:23S rRNA (guanosine(2251)-2'-O)-methyltransferase RlmB [Thalassobaculum fulvum]GHD58746.1 hypothetical protein GCM10017083_42170 [Thalassobaculum fulvum]